MSPSDPTGDSGASRGAAGLGRSIAGRVARFRRWADDVVDGPGQLEESELARQLRARAGVTRPNIIAVLSPKGGVGKTACTFLLGNVLASHLNQRVVAVEATPELGTLAALTPHGLRSERSIIDVMTDAETIDTVAAIRPYMSCLSSGLHVLAAPRDLSLASRMTPPSTRDSCASCRSSTTSCS
jgi:Mrp family chromosome partitioning ATPase